jgi:hypothetical protein
MIMESTSQIPSGRSLKKNLDIAALAASLEVSLGVAVGDVLAASEKLSSPPALSRQDKDNVASEQLKISNQSKMSNQIKDKSSSQLKINTQRQQN